MKEQTTGGKIAKRLFAWILSATLVVTMIPSLGLLASATGASDPTGSTVKAAVPSDGTGWTASGTNGLKYFQNIYGTGTQVTSLSYGQTLNASGSPYYIMNSITLRPQYPDSYKRTSALKISGNVKMIFLNNSSLTVQGGRALGYGEEYYRGSTKYTNWDSNMGGAGAGIELSSGNTLTVDGSGYIYATGGRAGNGQKGESPDGSNDEDSNSRGYHGGKGGRGGGGAGAGIGTKGGAGSTDQGSKGGGDAGDGSATASGGGQGGNGKNSDNSGTFIQYGNVRISATAGDGGRGGDRGTTRWESQSYRDAHGGGGGGGGAGLAANAIGSGGPGGGAGGGGGGGAVKRDDNGSCAGGSGGGGGGGWDGSQVAKGGERGAYDTEKGKTNAYGKDGKDASWDFDGSTFSGGAGGKRSTASSARAGKGGKGGSSGSYGNSGTIVGSNTGNGQQYRRTVDNQWAGGRSSTYCVVPKREITITVKESDTAKLNPDGKSYLYKPGVAVAPMVVIKHIPTGVTLNEDTYNYSVSPRQSKQDYNYYTVYSNNTGAPPVPNPREASVRVLANSLTADQWQRKIVNNNVNGGIPGGAGTLKDIDYKIDYETYKVTLDAAGGIGTRTVDVKLGATHTWGPGFNGNEINAPTREGFVFGGFFTEKDGEGTKYFDAINSDVSYAKPCKQWTTKGNGTLYAKWIPLTYKIRFWSDYGNGSEYVEYNLSDFVYENPSQPETSAKLKPATYGTLVLPSAHDLGISRDHYDFVGWNIYEEQDWAMYKAGKTYKAGLTTKQDDIVNIYAAWRAKDQLVVSYDANGGSGAPPVDGTWADADYKVSSQIPVRDGYTFKGWNSAAAPQYDENDKQTNGSAYTPGETVKSSDVRAIKSSTTLYAQWERNPSVSYRASGGTLESVIPTQYPAIGSTVNINYAEITRTGYDFVGWNVKGTNTVYADSGIGDLPIADTVVVNGKTYEVTKTDTFKMGSESVVLEALWTPQKMDIDYITDSKVEEPGLYDMEGWYYADAEGEPLETEGDTIKTVKSSKIEYDKPLDFQVVVDTDKVDDSGLRLRINDINTAPTDTVTDGNKVIYKYHVEHVRGGQMIRAAGLVGKTFPVVLDAGDGELRGNVTSHTFGEKTVLPVTADTAEADGNSPVRKGFAFEGWYDEYNEESGEVSGTKTTEISATTVPDNGSFAFYAKWQAGKYSIDFDIGPMPEHEGSTLQWQEGVTEAKYNSEVAESDTYKNIDYSAEIELPALSDYVKYEYGAVNGEGNIEQVEAKFLGWATKKSATEPEYASGQTVRRLSDKDGDTITLYAVWGAPQYKLALDANGGKLTKPITGYKAGDTIDLTEIVPVRGGYDFAGWYEEQLEDDADVSDKTKVESIQAVALGEKTYYAYWKAKTYKYTLKGVNLETAEDAEGQSWTSEDIKVGDTANLALPTEITVPEGKEIAGWTDKYEKIETTEVDEETDDEVTTTEVVPGKVLFDATETTADLWTSDEEGNFSGRTLYPVWKTAGNKTLVYDANGGSAGPNFVEKPEGTSVDIDFDVTPERTGYKFVGYDTDKNADPETVEYPTTAAGTDEGKITLTENTRLYAIWEPFSYDITFDAALEGETGDVGFNVDGEWKTQKTQKVDTFEEDVALAGGTPVRGSMYEFLGWSTEKNGAVEYNNGSVVSKFAEEVKEEIGEGENKETVVKGLKGKTLYAVWMVKDPAYLSFDANGGTGAPAMETHPQGTKVDVSKDADGRAKPTYHGYTFKGWATARTEAGETIYTPVDEVTLPNEVGNITLYAQWEKNKGVRMAYDAGAGATGSVPSDPTTYYKGETVNVLYRPAPAKTGHAFLGWDVKDETGKTVKELRAANEDDASFELTDEVFDAASGTGDVLSLDVKAVFEANKYTVKFDGNGAKSGDAPAAIDKTYDDGEVEMPKYGGEGADVEAGDGSLVPPTGFTFAGWNTEKDGSGKMYEAGRTNWDLSTAADDEVTLYAIWKAGEAEVRFDNGDRNSSDENYIEEKSFEYGQVLPDDLTAPTKTGHDFKGYYIEEYAHNDNGDYLDASGNVVEDKADAEIVKTKYFDENMEPLNKWDKTSADLKFQVEDSEKFEMKGEWEAQSYTISYHDDKGVLVSSQEITYGKDFRMADAADLEVPSGYRHVGWKLKNDPEQITPDFDADKGVTPTKANGLYNNGQTVSVYAVFQEIRKFTVNYDANGGTDAPQDTRQYEQGEYVEVNFDPVPKRANYDFLGWTTYSNTQSVLPGGANAGKYYGDANINGVESIDGKTYHYGEAGGSDQDKDINFQIKNDVKLYAVWVQKTYYDVDFYGNSTSNGGTANTVKTKNNKFIGPDNKTYTASESQDGYTTDEAIYRTTSKYNFLDKPTSITLPDGSQMFNNTDEDARFMGWAKNADAKVADHAAGEVLEDITMDENIVLSAVWAHPVKNVTLEDIDKPVYEGTPSENIEAGKNDGVSVSKITWTPSADTFAAGTDYKLTVRMKANDGYYFKKNALPTVKMDVKGMSEPVNATVSINEAGDILMATYTFTTTENIIVNGDKDTKKAEEVKVTGVVAPEAGKKLTSAGMAVDTRVDNGSWAPVITWSAKDADGNVKDVSTTAEPDTIYTATLRMKAAKGYEFNKDVTKVLFNGEEVNTEVDPNTKELVVTYTFPKTAKLDNTINLKLSGKLRNGQNLPDQTLTTAENVDKDSRFANITWYKVEKDGSLTEVDVEKAKVLPSTTYVAQVKLKVADGYTFTTDTAVAFGGDEMHVKNKDATVSGHNWAKLQDDGSILVSHWFKSSVDMLQEIYTPTSLSAEYGTKVSDVEGLPKDVTIITQEGRKEVGVTWVDENNVTLVTDEGTEKSTDAKALNTVREAHVVKIKGTVDIPEGVTVPESMTATTTLTIKVAADPRLVKEADAAALKETAQGIIEKTPANPDDEIKARKDALEKAISDMNDYIATWDDEDDPSTVDGIQEEIDKVRKAMYNLMDALEPIPVLPISKVGEVTIGDKLPVQVYSNDPRIEKDSQLATINWTNPPTDKIAKEDSTYWAHITFAPAYERAFREEGKIMFDDNVQIIIQGDENTDGNHAWIDGDGKLNIIRSVSTAKINLVSIDDPAAVEAEFGDKIGNESGQVRLPNKVNATTDAGERELQVNWDTTNIDLGDTTKREAHSVTVPGKAVKPDSIENPKDVPLDVEMIIHVAADPRLAPEAKAAALEEEANNVIEKAKEAGIAEEEIKALEDAIKDMDEYIEDLDNSTVKGIGEEMAKVQEKLDELNSFIEHNTLIEMTLFGTDEKNGYKLDYGDKISTSYNLVTATDKDNSVKTTAVKTNWKTSDINVKSATDYMVEVTLQAAEGAKFNVNRKIKFDGVEILMKNEAPEEGATEYATISADKRSVVVARTYTSNNANFESADAVADKSVSFGTEPTAEKLGLPAKDGIKTDDSNKSYEAEVDWDLSAYEKDYDNRNNANANRAAHEVTVTGTLKAVEGVDGAEGQKITAKIKVAADPRLEKEAAAVDVAKNAASVIAEAKKLGVGAKEIAALEAAVKAMNDEVSKDNLANSTAASDQKKIDEVDPNLKALQKVIDDKKAADKKAAEEAAKKKAAEEAAAKKAAEEAAKKKAAEEEAKRKAAEEEAKKKAAEEEAKRKAAEEAAKKKAAEEAAKKKAAEEKRANTVNNKVGIREGSNEKAVEKFISTIINGSNPKGSTFGKLRINSPKQTKTSVVIGFKKVKNAKKYVVYGNMCNTKGKVYKMKKFITLKKAPKKLNLKKIAGKKVKKGTYYKLMVVAYNSKNKVVSTSPMVHVATKGNRKKSNPTGLTVKANINKAGKKLKKYKVTKAITLKKGKTTVLKSKIKKAKRTKVQKHVAIRYESANKKIVTVNKKGKVKGIKKGKATVWAYTQNGLYKAIKVTVK